jgi:hypothetical protein
MNSIELIFRMLLARWGQPLGHWIVSQGMKLLRQRLVVTSKSSPKTSSSSESENAMEEKPSNPKDMVGCSKTPWSVLPTPVLAEAALGMFEGALKYGRHNYRAVGVRASIYYDATERHLTAWWEGEDLDPESGLSHITKAITSLMVLRDSMIRGNWTDDRPPATPELYKELNKKAAALIEQYADRNPKHYTNDNYKD